MQVSDAIFRSYDIRGLSTAQLSPELYEAIGRAFGKVLRDAGESNVVVGRDARVTSPEYASSLISGLVSSGIDVISIGLVNSPILYFATCTTTSPNGIMVTASHNPREYNGCKFVMQKKPFFGEQLRHIKKMIEEESYDSSAQPGKVTQLNIIPEYIDNAIKNLKPITYPLTVVVDYGSGVGAIGGKGLYHAMGMEVTSLFEEPDGLFPYHVADPTIPDNLVSLIDTVRETGADLGMALDGDADRVGAVTKTGRILWGDQLVALFSREVLKEAPGATIITEVKASQALTDDVIAHGGNPVIWKTGHSLIKTKMRETGALLAGEMSGHIFFADRKNFGYDDGIYAGARLCELVASSGKTLDELLDTIPQYIATPEIRLHCDDSEKTDIVHKITQHFAGLYDVIDIDGVRVLFGSPKNDSEKYEGWGLVRQSNTEPALIVRAEGKTEHDLEGIRKLLKEQLGLHSQVEIKTELD
ncbi:MAG: phosphomannomutase/phosphoglucomutase [Patescibacteria group bacterium]